MCDLHPHGPNMRSGGGRENKIYGTLPKHWRPKHRQPMHRKPQWQKKHRLLITLLHLPMLLLCYFSTTTSCYLTKKRTNHTKNKRKKLHANRKQKQQEHMTNDIVLNFVRHHVLQVRAPQAPQDCILPSVDADLILAFARLLAGPHALFHQAVNLVLCPSMEPSVTYGPIHEWSGHDDSSSCKLLLSGCRAPPHRLSVSPHYPQAFVLE